MSITDLLKLLESKLTYYNNAHATAATLGDIEAILILDSKIFETENTIEQIKSILQTQ